MEPARARSPVALSQRLQDIAERLSTLAKAELYQVLEGIAPTGEFSSLHRLDPLVNDIVFQISDSFKQAVVKRLLPEASKLLGSRSAALAAAPPWAGAQAPQSPGPTSLVSNVKQHPHLENDILALGLAPGTGQPLRPDQGPPQDAVSAAASSLLQGATAVAVPSPKQRHQSNLSPPPYTTSGSGGGGGGGGGCSSVNSGTSASALHPPESRFAFANVSGDIRRRTTPLSPPLGRDGSYGGNAAGNAAAIADLVSSADPLLLLGLGESGASLGFDAGGTGGDGATTNGLAVSVDSFLLGSSLAGSIGSAVGSGAGGGATPGAGGSAGGSGGVFTPVTSPSPNALGRHLGALSLATGTPGGSSGGGAASASAASAGRIVSSSISSPSPNPSTPSPYSSLPLTIRPGSSLDPGLATPPVSLAGTEPLRSTPQALPTPQQQHPQQLDRLSTGGDMSPLTPLVPSGSAAAAAATPPVPLFGGAPGPSPGGSSQQQLLRQHQVQQQHLQHQYMGVGAAGLVREVGGMAPNGNTTNGNAAAFHHQQQQQHVQAQYNLQQLQQQDMGEYPRQQYNLTQQQQQQQQLSALHYDGSGFASVSTVRAALAAAPDGPRASYDGRSPSGGYVVQNMQVPYDIQMMYGGSGVGALDLQQAGALGDRYSSPSGQGAAATAVRGSFASGGAASPDYGVYSLTPLAGGGGMGGAMVVDLIRSGSSGGSNAAAVTTMGILPPAGGAGAGGFGVGSGVGRSAGSPAMVLAASGAPGTAAGRPSRSGATSAGSVVDSCSSSFSTGPMGPQAAAPRRGSGNGGSTATVLPFIVQQSSPPASDASGPSSAASVSTAGVAAGGAGGLAAVKGGGAAASVVSADGSSSLSMAAKLQQVHMDTPALAASKPAPSPTGGGSGRGGKGGAGPKAPADMPGRFRCLPPAVQARIHALTRDNHVVLLKDFDEKVLSKMTLLVDKFGAAECLAMLDRIEEVLKGKAGRLANGPGYLDVSVSTRLDELKQRASGQVTAPEDYARSTLHSRIYAELRDLITRHGFLQWHHFDQGIINMLKKMPNATALERLNELAYHSFKNVDNPKSCIVSIFTTKPKYVTS